MALRVLCCLGDHDLQAGLQHDSSQGECPIKIFTMQELARITSWLYSVYGPSTHGDHTQLPSWSTICLPFKRVFVLEGGSLNTSSCVRVIEGLTPYLLLNNILSFWPFVKRKYDVFRVNIWLFSKFYLEFLKTKRTIGILIPQIKGICSQIDISIKTEFFCKFHLCPDSWLVSNKGTTQWLSHAAFTHIVCVPLAAHHTYHISFFVFINSLEFAFSRNLKIYI